MYDHRPSRTDATAKRAVFLLLVAAAAALVGSALVPSGSLALQCLGLFLLLPATQLAARYLALQYLYRIRPREDGSTDLEVYTYRGGARMQLVCRIALSDVKEISPLTKENRKPQAGTKRYHYAPDMHPANATVLSVDNADGACELLLAPDETMLTLLRSGMQPPSEP